MGGGEVRLVGLVKQGTAVAAHLPADALRVLPEAAGDGSAGAGA
jgi:hypothetical protein